MEINAYQVGGLEQAALEFAKQRIETIEKQLYRIRGANSPLESKVRCKFVRRNVREAITQLKALDALVSVVEEEMSR